MARAEISSEVHLGAQGRIVIPASLRRALNFKQGERLIAREEDGRLIIEKPENLKRNLRALFTHIPKDVSLANELIKERREKTKREGLLDK